MNASTLLTAALLAAGLTAGTFAVATADDTGPLVRLVPPAPAVPSPAVTPPAQVEDEGPGTEEPRYTCVDGICDTRGESDEGLGTPG